MNKLLIRGICLLFCLLTIFVPFIKVEASALSFSARAILPENQRNKNSSSYFDLRVSPEQEEILKVELTNDTDEEITVIASANATITNDNGIADYTQKKAKKDASAPFTFSEIAEIPEEIIIPKKSKRVVECKITMPKETFDGYILGGLYFEQKGTQINNQKEEAVAVTNQYSYVIGVLLSETDVPVKPELSLNEVKPTQINGNNAVTMNLQNKQAAMIKKLQVDAKLFYEDEKKPRYENHQETLTMAPNTNFNYKINLKEQPFVAGNYTVKVTANDGYQDWTWEKKFNIEETQAKKYNATAINLPPEKKMDIPWRWIAALSGLMLVIIISVIYYFKRKEKKARERAIEIKKAKKTKRKQAAMKKKRENRSLVDKKA